MNINDLKAKINEIGYLDDVVYDKRIYAELSSIDVDFENVDYIGEYRMPGTEALNKYEMVGDIPVAWCACGGDWERPVVFALYLGKDGILHGYIPINGNAYNHDKNCAYGSEGIDEQLSFEEIEKIYVFDANKLREDIKNKFNNV